MKVIVPIAGKEVTLHEDNISDIIDQSVLLLNEMGEHITKLPADLQTILGEMYEAMDAAGINVEKEPVSRFIIEDDQGIMAAVEVAAFDNITEAHLAVVDELILWFESEDGVDAYGQSYCNEKIDECNALKDDIKAGAVDEEDEMDISGFIIKLID